jgi:serine/threonine-protein kinase
MAHYETLNPETLFHDRYRVVRCINAGGMGAVYEVVDEKTDSRRALKVMLPSLIEDADLRARFELEARVTGKIESDHLARVSDAGVDEATGMPFLVMDLLQGEELGSLLGRRKVLPAGEVVLYLFEAALALDKTHAAGIVHRDLKPENLFITERDDGSPCVKVFDFGIAKVVNRAGARATRAMGTPLYMAPEQMRGDGDLGPAADIYALGHIAYTLLAGEPYWSNEIEIDQSLFATLSTVMLGAQEPPTVRASRRRGVSLPPPFDAWFMKVTAPRPQDRFKRATVAISALAVALGVSLPRASLAVQLSSTTPVPASSSGGTVPMTDVPPAIVAGGANVPPTALMNAAISRPPPAARKGRRALLVALAAVAAVAVAIGVALMLRPVPPPSEGGVAAPPALASALPVSSARVPEQPVGTTLEPPSTLSPAEVPADAPDAGPARAPSSRPPIRKPAPPPAAPPRKHEGIL